MAFDSTASKHYTIRIRERLDESWVEWFDPMSLECSEGETVLSGYLPDQSALHGILSRINSLGLQLIAVHQQEQDGQDNG